MSKYVNAADAAEKIAEKHRIRIADLCDTFGDIPAADVAPMVHGRWICINKRYGEYECSVCHGVDSNCSDYYGIHAVTEQEFCPNCGAKMDKEETNERI